MFSNNLIVLKLIIIVSKIVVNMDNFLMDFKTILKYAIKYTKLNTINYNSSKYLIKMLNSVGTITLNCLNENESADEESLIFEPFKNFTLMEENHCLQITNLTKAQFLQVMNISERLRNSKNRTKEQLLALYKYDFLQN